MAREPRKPVIIVSAGRSGSTLLHELLGLHPSLAWLPERLRGPTILVRTTMRAVGLPLLGRPARRLFSPAEVYPFWEARAPGFTNPGRDLVAADLTSTARDKLRRSIGAITTARRCRPLLKVTGWPRLGYLAHLFPDATFVHMSRDPRAAVRSFLHAPWWQKRATPEDWHWGPLSKGLAELWDRAGRTPLALACIQMRIYWDAYEATFERHRETDGHELRVHELSYEELCDDAVESLRTIVDIAGLEWTATFEQSIRAQNLSSQDFKWQQEMSPTQRDLAESLLQPCMEAYARRCGGRGLSDRERA